MIKMCMPSPVFITLGVTLPCKQRLLFINSCKRIQWQNYVIVHKDLRAWTCREITLTSIHILTEKIWMCWYTGDIRFTQQNVSVSAFIVVITTTLSCYSNIQMSFSPFKQISLAKISRIFIIFSWGYHWYSFHFIGYFMTFFIIISLNLCI